MATSKEKKLFYATKKLKEVRESREFTQIEMADILSLRFKEEMSQSTYKKLEQGIYGIKMERAIAISRELGIPIKELWEAR
jgi:transcriptional regulator with XRE-family HTH domain